MAGTEEDWEDAPMVIEPGAFAGQDGKTIPVSFGGLGGPVIGQATVQTLSIQQRARLYPCRRDHGGCGAGPGEFCVTGRGAKSYTAHLDRLDQENDAWRQTHG